MKDKTQDNRFPCTCCGYKTLKERQGGTYNICEVCFWEDDPIQFDDPDYEGGANRVSLRQAQKNFQEYGACERNVIKSVRRPSIDELRDSNWCFLD